MRRRHPPRDGRTETGGPYWIFGRHAVEAALDNPARSVLQLLLTPNNSSLTAKRSTAAERVTPPKLDAILPNGAVHQGCAALVEPLPDRPLSELWAADQSGVVLALDQITDPQNVGAILRSAAAFGARAVIAPERHSAAETGALAKAASGALDMVPIMRVKNLSRALQQLGEHGFFRIGLAGDADQMLEDLSHTEGPLALVLGAEGKGLRRLTRTHCDALCRIRTTERLASLNVSNAAAVALHWFALRH